MRNMRPIAEHKLQLMGARRQRDHCFGLPIAKVPVLIVRHDRLLELIARQPSIDEKMMAVLDFSTPAGATPMPEGPNCTRNGLVTSGPSLRLMK